MTDPAKLYGISNCDTIKKARNWLQAHSIEFDFHDYRRQGLERKQLQSMAAALGWEAMLNRRGTSWRALSEEIKTGIDFDSAIGIMLDNPAVIRRPILDVDGQLHLGFNTDQYEAIFG
ncbi:MAG: ArsC family reductase [Gammaproteobacteria bacterium]|nr:ArsC family reductase [Gammaproteobacteria bacterium]